MNNSFSDSYKSAGVDVTAGYEAVKLMKEHVKGTFIDGVLGGIGGFGGMFEPNISAMNRPVLVSGTDGVGTKLKLAFLLDKHDTVGIDCVAMCVNDVICCGAKPLFFLDYIAVGKNIPTRVAEIVKGVADGCKTAGCALIGGETAEMPGFYPSDEYDIAGFSVGMVDYDDIIDRKNIKSGDVLIGLASSGIHSNGFSLVRKALRIGPENVNMHCAELSGTLGEALLCPTKIYVNCMLRLIKAVNVLGISHITGGGFYENIPRMLPSGIGAKINKNSFDIPPIFNVIKNTGKIPERDMFNTFNMGIGMVFALKQTDVDNTLKTLAFSGEKAYVIGECTENEGIELV